MRYRDLETGVFLTRDPIGYGDGPNIYCYVHCNPITQFDALGLCTTESMLAATGHVPTADTDVQYENTFSPSDTMDAMVQSAVKTATDARDVAVNALGKTMAAGKEFGRDVVEKVKPGAKTVISTVNAVVDSDAYTYVNSYVGAVGGVQTVIEGSVAATFGTVFPPLEIPAAVMVSKGIGDAGLNMMNIGLMDMGVDSDDLLPSSTLSAMANGVGLSIDTMTGGNNNWQGKLEVVGDATDAGFALVTGNMGTGMNKALNLIKAGVEVLNSWSEEW